MNPEIRPFAQKDFPAWLGLWNANNLGIINEDLTRETWSRLLNPDFPIYGLGAFAAETLAGILHYVVHPTTGNIKMIAYMQDVYVLDSYRRKGIATTLLRELAAIGLKEGWARIYWLANNEDETVQKLYEKIGVKINFGLHVWPLEEV